MKPDEIHQVLKTNPIVPLIAFLRMLIIAVGKVLKRVAFASYAVQRRLIGRSNYAHK